MNFKNLHLILSSIIIIPVGLYYGFFINFIFTDWVDIRVVTTDVETIFKATMGIYLAFASLFILGIFKLEYWKTATIGCMLFMFGLGFGRIISIIFDGFPSIVFVLGTFGELVLGFYALFQLIKLKGSTS